MKVAGSQATKIMVRGEQCRVTYDDSVWALSSFILPPSSFALSFRLHLLGEILPLSYSGTLIVLRISFRTVSASSLRRIAEE